MGLQCPGGMPGTGIAYGAAKCGTEIGYGARAGSVERDGGGPSAGGRSEGEPGGGVGGGRGG
eukprot:681476-Rhodomonas_salina.2